VAVKVPYRNDNSSAYTFTGYHRSTGIDALKMISYYDAQTATVLNSEINASIAPLVSTVTRTIDVGDLLIKTGGSDSLAISSSGLVTLANGLTVTGGTISLPG